MANYIFQHLNDGLEITNPTVSFTGIANYDLATKVGGIIAKLETPQTTYVTVLENINIPTVNQGTVDAKGALAIQDYEV